MIPEPLEPLIRHLIESNIRPVIVGGFVRDTLIGRSSLDIDIELYGETDTLRLGTLLEAYGSISEVGKSFGVFKLVYNGYHIDFSLPRTETKTGASHRDFDVRCDSGLDFAEAARRRDFTINAIGYDTTEHVILDPYGGETDLRSGILRYVDAETFGEDPLRILRAVQFAARFNLRCDDSLIGICRAMVADKALEALPKERIFEEIKKLLLMSSRPSVGFELLKTFGALPFFAPMERFESTPQDPVSHPEGSVWIHTLMCIDEMASRRGGDEADDLVKMFAVLLHDIGKPDATVVSPEGKIGASGHARLGIDLARVWMERLTADKKLITRILPLVLHHGTVRKLFKEGLNDEKVLRLSTEVVIEELIEVASADFFGRTFVSGKPERFDAGEALYHHAKRLGVLRFPPPAFIQGRDLIALGLAPSKRFKTLINEAYEEQLKCSVTTYDEALKWVVTKL